MIYNWWKADWPAMRDELRGEDTWAELQQATPENCWQVFKEKIEQLTARHVPKKRKHRVGDKYG
jgi:hypothetical protein